MKLHTIKKIRKNGQEIETLIKTEDGECVDFVSWLRAMKSYGYIRRFAHIPNETYTTIKSQIGRIGRLGGDKGLCDYLVIIGKENARFGNTCQVWVEVKRSDGGTTPKEQQDWINDLREVDGSIAEVCKGANEAAEFVISYVHKFIEPKTIF